MTARFRLFISHSSRTRHAQQRLEKIVTALRKRPEGVDVLYDGNQIASGDEWRKRISHMLALCDGAAILLDHQAFRSPWVLAEAMVLSTRNNLEPRFRLVPASLLSPEKFDHARAAGSQTARRNGTGSWDPVDLSNIQQLHASSPTDIVTGILAALSAGGDLTARKSRLERYAEELAGVLQDAPRGALRDLADDLADEAGEPPTVFAGDTVQRDALCIARHFLRASGTTGLGEITDCVRRLGKLFVNRHGADLVQLLHPLAFDESAAGYLRDARTGFEPTLFQTEWPQFSVNGHLYLATLPDHPGRAPYFLIGDDPTAEGLRAELVTHYRQDPSMAFSEYGLGPPSEQEAMTDLRSQPFLACLPVVDAEVVGALRAQFPAGSFLLLHSADDDIADDDHARRVLPALGPVREQRLRSDYRTALGTVRARTHAVHR